MPSKASKLPDMSKWTLEQIRDFFDASDLGEFEADLEVVEKPHLPMRVVPVRLSASDVERIKAIAQERNLPYTTLIRERTQQAIEKEELAESVQKSR